MYFQADYILTDLCSFNMLLLSVINLQTPRLEVDLSRLVKGEIAWSDDTEPVEAFKFFLSLIYPPELL